MPDLVDLVLDLRSAHRIPANADDFLSLWTELEQRLYGACLQSSPAWQVETENWGTCGLLLADPAAAPDRVTGDTPFTVRSVLEPSQIRHKCASCGERGQEVYGPFICEACKSEGRAERVCDRHAVILNGSFRATCPRHSPVCSCGSSATFWCRGRDCRGAKAHCDKHRRYHPGDHAISYCPACYTKEFPACGHVGCDLTGSLSCEYVNQDSLIRCTARACSKHAFRWQVFGPHRRGPVLCLDHARVLRRLSREQLVFQIAASSCARDGAGGKPSGARGHGPANLPRLSVVRHIFINTRSEKLDIEFLDRLFSHLQGGLRDTGFEGRMYRSLKKQEQSRELEVKKARQDRIQGEEYFAQLQQILVAEGKADLASRIAYSDFRQKANLLYVHVPPDLIGPFKGKQGNNIKNLSRALGPTVKVEDK